MQILIRFPMLRYFGWLLLAFGLTLPVGTVAQSLPVQTVKDTALASDSVYQVRANLSDQDGKEFQWQDHRGKPLLVSMFYTTCKFVCPMLIDTMALTRNGLTDHERALLDVMLISFDPTHDDVKTLKSLALARALDSRQWTLARTDASSVRKIAATLGIQYRLLPDGEFNHTTMLVLLDGEGRIVARTRRMGAVDPEFLQQVKQTLSASSASHASLEPPELVLGKIVDTSVSGQITIAHQAIKHLGMGPMTMPFLLDASVSLKTFKVGDQVQFSVREDGPYLRVSALVHAI